MLCVISQSLTKHGHITVGLESRASRSPMTVEMRYDKVGHDGVGYTGAGAEYAVRRPLCV